MSETWLEQIGRVAQCEPVVRATVVGVRGSCPREVGAWMLIRADTIEGTVGGGAMEYAVIRAARAQLLTEGQIWWRDVLHFHLGPDLDQCCGGAVDILLERFGAAEAGALAALSGQQPVWLMRSRNSGEPMRRADQSAEPCSVDSFIERVSAVMTPLVLYGAGHVGLAVVRALAPLPFRLTWLDGARDAASDAGVSAVVRLAEADLLAHAAAAPHGAFHLVMTHAHTLDEALVGTILRAGTFGYLGLIGSETKAARFRQRLQRGGVPEDQIARLHCPIGLPGLMGKAPSFIAASVAADLLMRRQS